MNKCPEMIERWSDGAGDMVYSAEGIGSLVIKLLYLSESEHQRGGECQKRPVRSGLFFFFFYSFFVSLMHMHWLEHCS